MRLEAGLAKVLGDPGLVLAYRVPGERAYLDGRGQPVELPAPGGDRVAAPVERDGRELAMLIYDPSLDDDPELVEAVAAAAAITLDDARLQTESRERLASCAPRASASSPRATRSGGGSSATSTTGRSSGWSPWRSSCA